MLDKVQYGGTASDQAFQVSFEYEPHPLQTTTWRSGTKEEVADLVQRIHVEAKTTEGGDFDPVRIYDLEYDDDYDPEDVPAGCDAPDRALLCEVLVNDGMPTQSFEYASGVFGLTSATSQSAPDAKNHLRSATGNADVEDSVMDMNGDGRLDFVDSANMEDHTWDVYYGLAAGGFSASLSTKWCASDSQGTIDGAHLRRETTFSGGLAHTQKETVDLDGDGVPDFVDSTVHPWKVHLGTLDPFTCQSVQDPVPGFDPDPVLWSNPGAVVESGLTSKDMNGDRIRSLKRLADMNADGRPDLVIGSSSDTGAWTVYLNSGSSFVAATELAYGPGPISSELKEGNPAVRRTTRDLFDFNGDGLPDLVETGSGAFLVSLNNGQSFSPAIAVPIEGHAHSAVRAVKNSSDETLADFLDVNGDGLPDRVEWTGTALDVWINRGRSFSPVQGLAGGDGLPIRLNNSKGNTKIDMIDWNHDGMLDRVDARTNQWQVRLGLPTTGLAIRSYLMAAAKNGVGGVTYPTYQPSTRFENTLLPFVSWVLTATRRTDGLCGATPACLLSGNVIHRAYTYADGYFDGPTREFRGFGSVKEEFKWGASASHTPYRVVTFDQADHTRGQIKKEQLFGSNDTPLGTETYTWDTQIPDGVRTQVFLVEKKTEEFDADGNGEPPQCRLDRNEEPDVYGRVSTRCTLPCGTSAEGCSGNVEGQVTTTSAWANPSYTGAEPVVRERPASIIVSYVKPGGGSETLSQQTFTYFWPQGNVHKATTIGDGTTGGNAVVETTYGSHGNMTSVKDARGGLSESAYDDTPFKLFPSTETNAVGHAVQTEWDLRYGKETQVTGPNGEVTLAAYDAAGRVVCEAKPGQSCGTPSAEYTYEYGDPEAVTLEAKLSYVQVKTREPNNTTSVLPGYLLTRVYTDALGRERATATWREVESEDTLRWVVTKQVQYDVFGRVSKVYPPYRANLASSATVGLLEDDPERLTEYGYSNGVIDPTSRVRSVEAPDETVVTTEYSAAWTHVIDEDGNRTSSQADFLGREIQRKLHEGASNELMRYDYTYDGLDRLLTTRVGGPGGPTVASDWDALGRKRQEVDPDSGAWQTRYDLSGNPVLQDDPKTGQRVEACYDKANRVVLQCAYPSDGTASSMTCPADPAFASCGSGSEIARYTYDDQPGDGQCGGPGRVGQLTTVVDPNGGECWAYDTRGRVATQKKTIFHNGITTTAKMDFGYDQADHLVWVRYPDDAVGSIDHGYQPDGFPDSVESIIADADYDVFGRTTRITSLRNTEDSYVFDTTGADNFRLQTVQTWQPYPGVYHLNLAYDYEVRGRLEEVLDYRDAGTPLSNAASYCYDGIGRLTNVDRDPALGVDPCGAPGDERFVHSSLGNLTEKNGAAFGFAAGTHRATSFGSTYPSIQYDGNGSRTLKDKGSGNKDELLYDARGLLTQVKRWTGGSVTSSQTNLYDYAGQRVVRAPSSGAGSTIRAYSRYADASGGYLTKYYFLGERMVASWIVSAPQFSERDPELWLPPERIVLPPGLLYPAAAAVLLLLVLPLGGRRRLGVRVSLARSASLSVVFLLASSPVVLLAGCGSDPPVRLYHGDHLGSTQVVTDWSGNIYRQVRYTAYGEIRGRFDLWGNPAGYAEDARFEFTGYETDFAGLDYAGARFFDPELAQFGSHDPAGQYPSPYAYGPGDPLNGTDPSGACFGVCEGLILVAIVAAAQTAMAVTASFIDAYRQTGSARAGVSAAGHSAADVATFGIYSGIKAISHDDYGRYLADFYANRLTLGVYGTVKAFNNEQVAAGIVGAAASVVAIAGLASQINEIVSKPAVSGDSWQKYATSLNDADTATAPEIQEAIGDNPFGLPTRMTPERATELLAELRTLPTDQLRSRAEAVGRRARSFEIAAAAQHEIGNFFNEGPPHAKPIMEPIARHAFANSQRNRAIAQELRFEERLISAILRRRE